MPPMPSLAHQKRSKPAVPSRPARPARRGAVTLWTILFLPVLVILFAVMIEGVNLWLARVELENALEASALAAVKEWAEGGGGPAAGWTDTARGVGRQYAFANKINAVPVAIDKNIGGFGGGNPNENLSCAGDLIFGAITLESPYVFDAGEVPSCSAPINFAVRAQATVTVPSLICTFCDIDFGPFQVSACTTAMYDCGLQRPRLIRVEPENFLCP